MYGINSGTKRIRFKLLTSAAAVALGAALASTAISETVPQVGNTSDSSHVFLNFSEGKSNLLTPAIAANYMVTIDPGNSAQNFKTWLVQAGFIGQESDWTPNGQQIVTHQTSLANANPATDYGYNKINAFAHIIILNSADLGFIRNQYIRCKPDCLTPNAQIFTYLENYGPTQFAKLLKAGDIDPVKGDVLLPGDYRIGTGNQNFSTTNTREAVSIALERRATDPRAGGRIADVAFEWSPAPGNPTHNFGKMYAYFVAAHEPVPFDAHNTTDCNLINPGANQVVSTPRDTIIDESYFWPDDSGSPGNNQAVWDCKFNLRSPVLLPNPDVLRIGFKNPVPVPSVKTGDPFAPELDALGTKQMPSLCSICHGGNIPANVATSTTPWGTTGEVKEFKYLPADAVNSIFGCDDTTGAATADSCKVGHFQSPSVVGTLTSPLVQDATLPTTASNLTRSAQELELKRYNQAVLVTQGANPPRAGFFDANGVITGGPWTFAKTGSGTQTRPAQAGVEVILGWYADRNNLADASMSGVAFPNPTCAVDPTTGLPHPDCNEPILQNDGFVPVGWRGATSTGPAQPAGSHVTPSDLYLNMFAHDCRSCHLNREPSLQLATEAQFVAEKGNIQDYVFQPQCDFQHKQIKPSNIVMPLARITWERLWNGINPFTNVANDSPPGSTVVSKVDNTTVVPNPDASTSVNDLTSPINKLKAYFGQTPTSYCKNH
jgi:hypothetical protein